MKKLFTYLFIGFILSFTLFTNSCKKDKFISETGAQLNFSTDTIIFDTVFSTIGSITLPLKVYNPHKEKIKISQIFMAGGKTSQFIMNVDGVPGYIHKDIILEGGDSIFIFIEVTVDPNNTNSPFVVSDSIVFLTNGNIQYVNLVAWGQDAYYHTANAFAGLLTTTGDTFKFWYHSIFLDQAWTNDKPHLIYGYAIVEAGVTLTIGEGTQVHMHKNSGIIVGNPFSTFTGASLKVSGSFENEVVFQGDRLDAGYEDTPGQWDRIWFTPLSLDNEIDYAIIKNGNIAIQADTNINSNPTVKLTNTIIQNHSGIGILGQGARIEGENLLVRDCGQHLVAMVYGGNYKFDNCSFGNFWDLGNRSTPSLLMNNYFEDANGNIQIRDINQADFNNCIIYGTNDEEIEFDKNGNGQLNFSFNHCILKTELETSSSEYINILKNPVNSDPNVLDPVFVDPNNGDFKIYNLSIAVDNADVVTANFVDIEGMSRDAQPDIGCYEFVP